MATTLSNISLVVQMLAKLTDTRDGQAVESELTGADWTPATALTHGNGPNQADRWLQQRDKSVTSGNSENLNLYSGAGFDPSASDLLGNSIALVKVVAIFVRNQADSAGTLRIGGLGTGATWNSFFNGDDNAVVDLKPGGFFFLFSPTVVALDVEDTTNHLLKMAAVSGNVIYDALALGRNTA